MKCGKGIFIIGAAALTTMTLSCVHRPRGEWSELGFLDGNGDGRLDGYEALDILLMFSDDFDGPIPIEELGKSAAEARSEAEREAENLLKSLDFNGDGKTTVAEIEESGKSGGEFSELVNMAPLFDADGSGVISIEEVIGFKGEEVFLIAEEDLDDQIDMFFSGFETDSEGAIAMAALMEEIDGESGRESGDARSEESGDSGISHWDADGDGRLEREELRIAWIGENTAASFRVEGETAHMNGVINASTPAAVLRLIFEHPEVRIIEMGMVPGSIDDESNLRAAGYVRSRGFTTKLNAESRIFSGGTDFFLAGSTRIIEAGAQVGIHSWSAGSGEAGWELPENHPDHRPYLDYYESMGIPADFYWFTLTSAPPDGMHIMSEEELARYNFPAPNAGSR